MNDSATASLTETTSTPEKYTYRGGRPWTRDWFAERAEIKRLLADGYGCYKLGKHYSMSPRGMRLVLERLGLRTKWAQK
jgi:hypothetical protein